MEKEPEPEQRNPFFSQTTEKGFRPVNRKRNRNPTTESFSLTTEKEFRPVNRKRIPSGESKKNSVR
jgi:hypothetical protein